MKKEKYCEILCEQFVEQEAYRPRLAQLNDTATADMQMICNIFPILSLQLMKGS